jgi:hypothetical protein
MATAALPPSPNRIINPCFSMQNILRQAKTAPLYFISSKAKPYQTNKVSFTAKDHFSGKYASSG